MINKKIERLKLILNQDEIKLLKDQNLETIDCQKIKSILGLDDFDIDCQDVNYLLENEEKGIILDDPYLETVIILGVIIFYIFIIFRFIENDFVGILINTNVILLLTITYINLFNYSNFLVPFIIITTFFLILNYLFNKVSTIRIKRIIYNILFIFFMLFNLYFIE